MPELTLSNRTAAAHVYGLLLAMLINEPPSHTNPIDTCKSASCRQVAATGAKRLLVMESEAIWEKSWPAVVTFVKGVTNDSD